jgi:tripartite-type tricarboxylate transporter receptor subunit TctC
MKRRSAAVLLAASLLATVAPQAAHAQAYPDRPIRIVVGFPPGGINDIVARIVGQKVSESIGQPVIVDNRAGAGGTIGADYVAKAKPDGYTLLLGSVSNVAMASSLYKALPYDPARDFSPIILLGGSPNVLVVNPAFPATTVAELITIAKEKPGTINYASAGKGTSNHLTVEYFKALAGIDLVHVPYKGDAPATADVVGGQVPMIFPTLPVAMPHIKSGKLRALAVSSARRSVFMPDVPTIAEAAKLADFAVNVWVGILAPPGTPQPVVQKLNAEFRKALEQPDVREKLAIQGVEPEGGTAQEFSAYIAAEVKKWGEVAKAAKVEPN